MSHGRQMISAEGLKSCKHLTDCVFLTESRYNFIETLNNLDIQRNSLVTNPLTTEGFQKLTFFSKFMLKKESRLGS